MRTLVTTLGAAALLAVGYFLGTTNILSPALLMAQADDEEKAPKAAAKPKTKGEDPSEAAAANVSEETRVKIKAAADALTAAMDALKTDGQYNSATKGVNTFAILTGGGDSVKDLESGRGVDPETFAALYGDLVVDELKEKLGHDPEGRLTFNGKVIRMYPVSRLKSLYAVRGVITGEQLFAKESSDGETKKPAKKKPAAEETTEEPKEDAKDAKDAKKADEKGEDKEKAEKEKSE